MVLPALTGTVWTIPLFTALTHERESDNMCIVRILCVALSCSAAWAERCLCWAGGRVELRCAYSVSTTSFYDWPRLVGRPREAVAGAPHDSLRYRQSWYGLRSALSVTWNWQSGGSSSVMRVTCDRSRLRPGLCRQIGGELVGQVAGPLRVARKHYEKWSCFIGRGLTDRSPRLCFGPDPANYEHNWEGEMR